MKPSHRLGTVLGAALVTPLFTAGIALAGGPPPVHDGDPALWGPALERFCTDPDIAERNGYNVIEGTNFGETLVGGPAADAIYAYGGNDTVFGAAGDDVLCLGFGNDEGKGEQGNDAVFGEAANDDIRGDKGRDYLDGGGQLDDCNGGAALDAADDCEALLRVP